MNYTGNARAAGENGYTDTAIVSKLTPKGPRVILADGREVKVKDRNHDTGKKRDRTAKARFRRIRKAFPAGAVVWEYGLRFPDHLDVLDHGDAQTMWDTIEAIAPDAVVKLEDVRSNSLSPEGPHAHFLSTVFLSPDDIPGLWRYPEPLDLEAQERSSQTRRTLYGFLWYTAKPVLGGAVTLHKDKENRQLVRRFGVD